VDRGKRCEVAKRPFCSEEVKTATLSPCEVATCVGGCVYDNGQGCNFKTVRNIGLNFRKQPKKHQQNTLLFLKRDRGFGGKRKTSFHMEKKFSSSPRFPYPLSEKGII
jgi:hypothetical protein